jgi:hypothetical protein
VEETADVERVSVYYRPAYVFQYRWLSKSKEAIAGCDALPGELQAGGKTLQQCMGKVMDAESVSDGGVDAAGSLVSGQSTTAGAARRRFDVARSLRKKRQVARVPRRNSPPVRGRSHSRRLGPWRPLLPAEGPVDLLSHPASQRTRRASPGPPSSCP